MAILFVAASGERVNLGTALNLFRDEPGATMMGWARLTTAAGSLMQCSVGTGTSPSRLTLEISGGAWQFGARRLDADGLTQYTHGSGAPTATWQHLALIARYTGGQLEAYIDGALVGTVLNGGWTANSSNTNAGAAHMAAEDDGASNFLNGSLDDVRCYERALSAAEINTIYRARGADSIILGLSHRWPMNEAGSGASASGVGSVRDKGGGGPVIIHGDPEATPTYIGEFAVHRRKRRAA